MPTKTRTSSWNRSKTASPRASTAFIIIPQDGESAVTIVKEAQSADVPIAVFNRPPTDTSKGIVVVADNKTIAEQAVDYIVEEALAAAPADKTLNAIIIVGGPWRSERGRPQGRVLRRHQQAQGPLQRHRGGFEMGCGNRACQPGGGGHRDAGHRSAVHLLRLPLPHHPVGARAAREMEETRRGRTRDDGRSRWRQDRLPPHQGRLCRCKPAFRICISKPTQR